MTKSHGSKQAKEGKANMENNCRQKKKKKKTRTKQVATQTNRQIAWKRGNEIKDVMRCVIWERGRRIIGLQE